MPPPPSKALVKAPMTREEAETLTALIKSSAETLYSLLLDAHDREAWRALDYPSWRAYAMAEFDLSKSRAYELLTHSRVLSELENSGIPEKPNAFQSAELARVPAGERADVWAAANEATNGKPTAKAIAMAARFAGVVPSPETVWAASRLDVSPMAVLMAGKIRETCPKLAARCKAGTVTLFEALDEIDACKQPPWVRTTASPSLTTVCR